MAAVLDKSASVGVRGEITGKYLDHLGFRQYDIIGCPSMYMKGDSIKSKSKKQLNKDSRISITASSGMPDKFLKLISSVRSSFPDHYFVPQELKEFELLYAGVGFPQRFKGHDLYPNNLNRSIYQQNRVLMFYNVPSWKNYMKAVDFSFGSRIHGNIIATLEGVPAIVFSFDSRTRELADYHNIPYIPMHEINENTRIQDLYEKTDFGCIEKGHKKRFEAFISFL